MDTRLAVLLQSRKSARAPLAHKMATRTEATRAAVAYPSFDTAGWFPDDRRPRLLSQLSL